MSRAPTESEVAYGSLPRVDERHDRTRQVLVRSLAMMAACGVVPLALIAQEVRPDSLPPVELEPVTVTVLRVPFPLHLIPHAVAIGGDSIVTRGQPRLSLGEVLAAIPGVNVQNRFNYALGDRISIRGFGARTQFGIRGVKILVDGVPATLADGQSTLDHLDLATVDRVEVIRGPTSSLYGNASGGVVRFETGIPGAARFRQEIGTLIGSDGLVRLETSTAGRTGPTTFGLDLTRFSYDGYREHSESDKYYATWHLGYQGERDALRIVANLTDFDALNPGSLNDSLLAVDRDMANPFNRVQGTGKDARQGHVGISWTRTAANRRFEASVYGLLRDLVNPIPVRVIELDRSAGGLRTQLESTALLSGRVIRWTLGLETDLQRDDRKNFENDRGDRGALSLDQLETVWGLGSFVQISVPVTNRLHVLTGLRYDRIRFEADDRFTQGGDPDDSGTRTMDAASPSVGLLLDLTEPLRVYANLATSFETPTTTELVNRPSGAGGFNPELDPQRAFSLELGVKGRIGATLDYQVAVYRTRVTDELIPFEVASEPGRAFFRNAGSAVHRGIEVGGSLLPASGLSVRAAYTYTDARFDRFEIADDVFDGNEVPGVAPHRVEVFASYDSPYGWYVAGGGQYVGEMAVNDENDAFSPDYLIVDVRAGLRSLPLGQWSLEPFLGISNVVDTEYNSSVTVNAFGGRYFEPGPGREVWVGARLGFGR